MRSFVARTTIASFISTYLLWHFQAGYKADFRYATLDYATTKNYHGEENKMFLKLNCTANKKDKPKHFAQGGLLLPPPTLRKMNSFNLMKAKYYRHLFKRS